MKRKATRKIKKTVFVSIKVPKTIRSLIEQIAQENDRSVPMQVRAWAKEAASISEK